MTERHNFFEPPRAGRVSWRILVIVLALATSGAPAQAIVPDGPCARPIVTFTGRSDQQPPGDDDPKLTLRARDWIDRVALGDVDRREFSDELNELLGPEALAAKRHLLEGMGTPQRLVLLTRTREAGRVASSYVIQYPGCRSMAYVFAIGEDGKITTLLFAP